MRLEINDKNKFAACSVKEFVRIISFGIVSEKKVYRCDFAERSDETEISLREVAETSKAWFGIERIPSRFDTNDICLYADYYGGGCFEACCIPNDFSEYNHVFPCVMKMILDSMRHNGYVVDANTSLIVEFIGEV